MTDIKPPGPPIPDESKPQELPKTKESKGPPASEKAAQESDTYLGLTFSSHAAYVQFKSKFLAQMANEMIKQIQSSSDHMVEALKKMREDQE